MAQIISLLLQLVQLLVFARVLISWFRPNPYNPVVKFIHDVTEPLLAPIRQLIPPSAGMDFSPLILLIGIMVIERTLLPALL